jgi:anti-anti-sigma regulatory factor
MADTASVTRVVKVRGDLTAASGHGLLDAARWGANEAAFRIVIDVSQMTTVDRGGATALLDLYVAVSLRRGSLALMGLTTACHSALSRAGVLDVIDVVGAAAAPVEQLR